MTGKRSLAAVVAALGVIGALKGPEISYTRPAPMEPEIWGTRYERRAAKRGRRRKQGKRTVETNLGKRIAERADKDGLSVDHPLRVKAQAFEDATKGFYADPQTVDVRKFMGAYAKVKLLWRDYSGEALV